MEPQFQIYCDKLTCSMSMRSCEANRALAHEAILLMTEAGFDTWGIWREEKTLLQLPTQQINRFLVCGPCPRSSIDPAVVRKLFREGVQNVVHRIDVFNEYGFDKEVSQIRRREWKKKWREDNQDYIKADREERRRNKRIADLGGTNG